MPISNVDASMYFRSGSAILTRNASGSIRWSSTRTSLSCAASSGSSGAPWILTSTPATPSLVAVAGSRVERGDRETGSPLERHRVVDSVRLGDRAPARRIAVSGVGDRLQRVTVDDGVGPEPGGRASGRILPGVGPRPDRLSLFSTWISVSLTWARIGVPSGANRRY